MNYNERQVLDALNNLDKVINEDELCDDCLCCISDDIYDCTNYNEDNCDICSGASKVCIIPKDADYVIKIPYYYLSDDSSSGFYNSYGYWEPNEDGGRCELFYNYCNREANFYKKAETEYKGAELFLAKTQRIFRGNVIEGYVQEKVTCYYDYPKDNDYDYDKDYVYDTIEEDYRKTSKNSLIGEVLDDDLFCGIPSFWYKKLLEYAVKNNALSAVENFFKFLLDSRINDLNPKNIGFINDKPVLMDYAGWEC